MSISLISAVNPVFGTVSSFLTLKNFYDSEMAKRADAEKPAVTDGKTIAHESIVADLIAHKDNLDHGNVKGEIIPSAEYKPGSTGYGQDYSRNQTAFDKWASYITYPESVGASPDKVVETVQDAAGAVTNFQFPEIKFPELPDLSKVDWKKIGLVCAGGLLLVVAVSGVTKGIVSKVMI